MKLTRDELYNQQLLATLDRIIAPINESMGAEITASEIRTARLNELLTPIPNE